MSEIKVDTLTGKTTAGNITVTSEWCGDYAVAAGIGKS